MIVLFNNSININIMNQVIITTFYHFINLPNYESLKEPLLNFCKDNGLKGTILVAREGVNSTISGTRDGIDKLYIYLRDDFGITDLVYKESFHENQPFQKMKVNLKKEIVALGVEDLDVENLKGEYISPKDWDDFISREDVIVIDTRNKYETLIGSFDNAIDPKTATFRQFPKWVKDNLDEVSKEQKIAMFCTGGVRCEKSTAFLKAKGFKNVYHLEGGILKYFEDTEAKAWHGSCFVFDDRVALNKQLVSDQDLQCGKCEKHLDTDDLRRSALSEKMICIECVCTQ
ncbi:MAG: rhodanese-related sulfurtransferase [Pseudomonadota bacterium]